MTCEHLLEVETAIKEAGLRRPVVALHGAPSRRSVDAEAVAPERYRLHEKFHPQGDS